jgi:ribonuclease BN (tRNA processing enzyme)
MGPSVLMRLDSENMIVDAGRGVSTRLVQAGVKVTEVNDIFLTHLHFDHTSGLADLLFSSWNLSRNRTINIYGPTGTSAMVKSLLDAHERDIWYRLQETALTTERLVDIREMVKVYDCGAGQVISKNGWRVDQCDVNHGHGLGLSRHEWHCHAIRVSEGGASTVITGDAVISDELIDFSRGADVMVAGCYYSGEEVNDIDTKLISKHVLMSSLEVGKLASEARISKLVLTHIREKTHEQLERMILEVRRDFTGDVVLGEDLLTITAAVRG